MKPITTFVRHNGIKALLAIEDAVKNVAGGKLTPNLIKYDCKPVGTDVKIIKETETETFIAKCNPDGSIKSGEFKILVTTDLHLCDNQKLITKTLDLLALHVAIEKPDLILFTGDVVLTDCQQIDAIQFGRYMEKMGVYWAYIFGNHEGREEKEYHKYFLLKNLESFPHCLTKIGDENLFGYGNFAINIMNSENSIQQSIIMLDSGRDITPKYRAEYNVPAEIKGYDFLKNNQIYWYENEIKALREEYGEVKSMMCMHIPLPEYQEVMTLKEVLKLEDGCEREIYEPTGKAEILYGGMYESVGCSQFNSGMFDKILELGSTQAVFAGHDHVNDFCALYKGVYLVYGQCGGYNTYTMGDRYGFHDEKDWIQGVTLVDLHEDGSVNIRQKFNRDYIKTKNK